MFGQKGQLPTRKRNYTGRRALLMTFRGRRQQGAAFKALSEGILGQARMSFKEKGRGRRFSKMVEFREYKELWCFKGKLDDLTTNSSRLKKNESNRRTQEWGNYGKGFKMNTKSIWRHVYIYTYIVNSFRKYIIY